MKTDNEYLERAREIISTAGIRDNSIALMAIKYIFPELNAENTGDDAKKQKNTSDDAKSRNHKTNRVFPVIARENKTGKLIIINGGQLDDCSDEYIKYVSDDGYHVYNPDEIIFYDECENDSEKKKETSDFNVGDWIVEELSGEWLVVTDDTQSTYTAENRSGEQFFIQKESTKHNGYHRWTQDDAKPGDVLADYAPDLDNPLIFILKDFKHIKYNLVKESDYHSFCFLKANERQQFCTGRWHHIHDLKPATAKQQELLFRKMKESGYSWNPKTLELSKTKLETKFKIGDWITDGQHTVQISEIDNTIDGCYRCFNGNHEFGTFVIEITKADETFHSWSIKDAKKGDVLAGDMLATKYAVFIFKHMDLAGLSLCKSYCEVIGDSGLGLGFDFSINGTHPATKEQRNHLFKKIKDAGYEWNPVTLELTRNEQ